MASSARNNGTRFESRRLDLAAFLSFLLGSFACSNQLDDCAASRTCSYTTDAGDDGVAGHGGSSGSGGGGTGAAGVAETGGRGSGGEPPLTDAQVGDAPVDAPPRNDGGCGPCSPPENATATCAGKLCDFVCNGSLVKSGAACVPDAIYISPVGLDTNSGTQFSAYRTFDKAASVAVSGQKILAAGGTYGGADFSKPIPVGVTVDRSNATAAVVFSPSGSRTLAFAGDGTLRNVTLKGFYTPLAASTGTQTVDSVVVTNPVDAIVLTGTAKMTMTNMEVSGKIATPSVPLISVDGSATLAVTLGSVSGTYADCTAAEAGRGITARGAATVSVTNVSFTGPLGAAIDWDTSAALNITGGVFNSCNGIVSLNLSKSSSRATIRNATFWGYVFAGGPGKLVVRGSRFFGGYGLYLGDSTTVSDAGTAADPGGNHFEDTVQYGVIIFASGVTLDASGNTWVPSQQGADAQGHYAVGTNVTTSGRNATMGPGGVVRM